LVVSGYDLVLKVGKELNISKARKIFLILSMYSFSLLFLIITLNILNLAYIHHIRCN
jgi:hypothetical protein